MKTLLNVFGPHEFTPSDPTGLSCAICQRSRHNARLHTNAVAFIRNTVQRHKLYAELARLHFESRKPLKLSGRKVTIDFHPEYSMYDAMEFGFRCCEKGMNLEMAKSEFARIRGAK